MTSEELKPILEGCKNGNQKFQKILYETYSPMLFGICLRYANNNEDAKDVLQTSFVKILTNINDVNNIDTFIGWMKTIVINESINQWKDRKKRYAENIDDVDYKAQDTTTMHKDFILEQELLEYIKKLPQGYRTVFNMFVIDGYSQKEIAEKLGCSNETVRTQFFKAKRHLVKKIQQHGLLK